jgi:hypothetical protein
VKPGVIDTVKLRIIEIDSFVFIIQYRVIVRLREALIEKCGRRIFDILLQNMKCFFDMHRTM